METTITPAPSATLDTLENITRRELLLAVPLLALAAAGISCSSDPTPAPTPTSRRVSDAFGEVDVPANPTRVVAVRHHHIGNMLALGLPPIGIVPDASEFPLPGHAEALAGATNVRADTDWALDVEKALALQPDLILEMSGQPGDPWNKEVCDLVRPQSTIACYPYGYSTDQEIKQNLLDVGAALGREAQARDIIAAYDARVTALKAAAKELAGRPVASIVWTSFADSGFFVPLDRPANVILRSLEIPQASFQSDPSVGEVSLSFENLSMLNEASVVLVFLEGDATPEGLTSNDVWNLLEPVKAGRVLFLDGNIWGWDYMPAMSAMLDDVEAKLLPLAAGQGGA